MNWVKVIINININNRKNNLTIKQKIRIGNCVSRERIYIVLELNTRKEKGNEAT